MPAVGPSGGGDGARGARGDLDPGGRRDGAGEQAGRGDVRQDGDADDGAHGRGGRDRG